MKTKQESRGFASFSHCDAIQDTSCEDDICESDWEWNCQLQLWTSCAFVSVSSSSKDGVLSCKRSCVVKSKKKKNNKTITVCLFWPIFVWSFYAIISPFLTLMYIKPKTSLTGQQKLNDPHWVRKKKVHLGGNKILIFFFCL